MNHLNFVFARIILIRQNFLFLCDKPHARSKVSGESSSAGTARPNDADPSVSPPRPNPRQLAFRQPKTALMMIKVKKFRLK